MEKTQNNAVTWFPKEGQPYENNYFVGHICNIIKTFERCVQLGLFFLYVCKMDFRNRFGFAHNYS
jgi:hypothetical protein